jgi:hypothetical protein
LIKTNVTLSDLNGQASEAQGVLNVDLTVGSKTVPTSFFIVSSKITYTVLLGREWIHADDSIEISLAAMSVWDAEDQEPISGISLEGCDCVEATKKWCEAGLIHRPHRVDEVLRQNIPIHVAESIPAIGPKK